MDSGDLPVINYSILTVSDRCANGLSEDLSGAALRDLIKKKNGYVTNQSIIADDVHPIETKLKAWVEEARSHVILTTGGTGFAPRDVTPEATLKVIEKRAQGMEVAMTVASLKSTPFGMLSRAVCGISEGVLIVNLPGSKKGATECYEAIAHTIPHAVALLKNDLPQVKSTHGENPAQKNEDSVKSQVSFEVVGRSRQSEWKMVDDTEAHSIIEKVISCARRAGKIDQEKVKVKDAYGRVLAQDVVSSLNIPATDVSLKDGYAVKSAFADMDRIVVNHSEPATKVQKLSHLPSNMCVRVTTGAPLPPGADAVVQVEDTELLEADSELKEERLIKFNISPLAGLDVRKCGSDVKKGDVIAQKGMFLKSVHLGRIASVGVTSISVFKKPTVAVMSTGNEIVDASSEEGPTEGKVYDSNRIILISMFRRSGFNVVDLGIVADEPSSILERLSAGLDQADVIVSSGGVSMGEKDFMKPVLKVDLGAEIHFGRVNIKPGKPTTFASLLWKNVKKFVFALPGNPSSSLATCIVFVLPTLDLIEGRSKQHQEKLSVMVKAKGRSYKLDDRVEYYRANVEYDENNIPTVMIGGTQPSSDLSHFASASVLVRLPSAGHLVKEIDCTSGILAPVIFIDKYL